MEGEFSSSSDQDDEEEGKRSIKLIARLRPLLQDEMEEGQEHSWMWNKLENTIERIQAEGNTLGDTHTYRFDHVFGPDESTASLYKDSVQELVHKACVGLNASVMNYGQSGSGKTHTFFGSRMQERGLLVMAVGDIFAFIAKAFYRQFLIRLSYFQIEKETLYDMLSEDPSKPIELDMTGEFSDVSVTEKYMRTPQDFLALSEKGLGNTAARQHTHPSSLHSVIRLCIESREKPRQKLGQGRPAAGEPLTSEQAPPPVRKALLSFFDLAEGAELVAEHKASDQEGPGGRETADAPLARAAFKGCLPVLLRRKAPSVQGCAALFGSCALTHVLKPLLTPAASSVALIVCLCPGSQDAAATRRWLQAARHMRRRGAGVPGGGRRAADYRRRERGYKGTIKSLLEVMQRSDASATQQLQLLTRSLEELEREQGGKGGEAEQPRLGSPSPSAPTSSPWKTVKSRLRFSISRKSAKATKAEAAAQTVEAEGARQAAQGEVRWREEKERLSRQMVLVREQSAILRSGLGMFGQQRGKLLEPPPTASDSEDGCEGEGGGGGSGGSGGSGGDTLPCNGRKGEGGAAEVGARQREEEQMQQHRAVEVAQAVQAQAQLLRNARAHILSRGVVLGKLHKHGKHIKHILFRLCLPAGAGRLDATAPHRPSSPSQKKRQKHGAGVRWKKPGPLGASRWLGLSSVHRLVLGPPANLFPDLPTSSASALPILTTPQQRALCFSLVTREGKHLSLVASNEDVFLMWIDSLVFHLGANILTDRRPSQTQPTLEHLFI